MSIDGLDPVIHAPKRLAVMAVLAASSQTDFGFLREHLAVSDSDLSKQMAALERAGYVAVTKSSRGRGGVTTYRATRSGLSAYRRHVRALRDIVGAADLADRADRAERADAGTGDEPADLSQT